ncbi:MAG: hypothetical protein J7497_02270 [Chitinophagaceae bacterium]|nr:hypothetical protein [Chitinophagaceae bacterium]
MLPIRTLIVAIIVCALFTTCRKYDLKNPLIVNCKVLETSERTLQYNQWGDPISCTYKINPDETGKPTFFFVYDSKRRLIAYHGFNDHYLTYNTKGQVVADTMIQNYGGQDDRYSRHLYYDHYGRIIKETSIQYHTGMPDPDRPPVWEEETTLYNYDNRGNLIIPGVSYDDKTNVNRTHPAFQIIDRNYSLNNPVTNTTYNAQGLPRNFISEFLEQEAVFDLVYSCDGGGKK